MKKHYRKENNCLNCGATLTGKFCQNCGQENLEIKESFGHMMNHAISDYFHFDHQFFGTLKPLLFKPGFLTIEYLNGRRASYLHPVKMYIFISVVYFLLAAQFPKNPIKAEVKPATIDQIKKQAIQLSKDTINYKTEVERQGAINRLYHKNGYKLLKNKLLKDTSIHEIIFEENSGLKLIPSIPTTNYHEYLEQQSKLPAVERDLWITKYITVKAIQLYNKKININEVVNETLSHNFPKFMFLILPFFALILSITFRKTKRFYVEHLIYAFHLTSFIYLILTVNILVRFILPKSWLMVENIISMAIFLYIFFYIYRSLKVFYNRNWFRTILKMVGMSISYLLVFLFSFVAYLFILILFV